MTSKTSDTDAVKRGPPDGHPVFGDDKEHPPTECGVTRCSGEPSWFVWAELGVQAVGIAGTVWLAAADIGPLWAVLLPFLGSQLVIILMKAYFNKDD